MTIPSVSLSATVYPVCSPSPVCSPPLGRRTPSTKWAGSRLVRLGYLAALGYDAKRIARDELIRSTPDNVYQQCHRFGIALRNRPMAQNTLRLPADIAARCDHYAGLHGLTRETLLARTIIAVVRDAGLQDQVWGAT